MTHGRFFFHTTPRENGLQTLGEMHQLNNILPIASYVDFYYVHYHHPLYTRGRTAILPEIVESYKFSKKIKQIFKFNIYHV